LTSSSASSFAMLAEIAGWRYRDSLRAFRETAGLGDRDEMFDLVELHG